MWRALSFENSGVLSFGDSQMVCMEGQSSEAVCLGQSGRAVGWGRRVEQSGGADRWSSRVGQMGGAVGWSTQAGQSVHTGR